MLIFLTVSHTLQIFHLIRLTNFQHFPGPVALFQGFPDLVNAKVKFQDFPGCLEPIQTLYDFFSQKSDDFPYFNL